MLQWIKYLAVYFVVSLVWVLMGCGGEVPVPSALGVFRVTIPNESAPPCCSSDPSANGCFCPQASGTLATFHTHGNGKLWVGGLPGDGKLLARRDPQGSYSEKFLWWRAVQGQLSIRGRRLDESADPLQAHIPCCYGDTGFQASGVIFPTEGFWEITGQAGDAALTFVLEVRFES